MGHTPLLAQHQYPDNNCSHVLASAPWIRAIAEMASRPTAVTRLNTHPGTRCTSVPSAAMPLTTSPLVFSVPADFLTNRNGSRLSRFFSVGYVHVEQNWLPTDSMLLLAQYRSVISLSPGEGSNHPFPGTAHTLSVLCGWSLCNEHTLL